LAAGDRASWKAVTNRDWLGPEEGLVERADSAINPTTATTKTATARAARRPRAACEMDGKIFDRV